MSARRRRWLRWIFAVIFAAGVGSVPLLAEQVPFGPQQVISTDAEGARSVFAADVDGDGDVDALSASNDDDKIAWYENTDGAGNFGPQQVISTDVNRAKSVFAADVDGDGDVDVLSASRYDDKIAWYENTDGAGNFGPQQVISTDANSPESVFAADVDGDGDVDVLSASAFDDKIAWYENTDGVGTFGPQQVISTDADSPQLVFAADVDGDGDVDVLSASAYDDKIAWYENTDGAGTFGSQQVISTDADGAWSVFAADVDGDGDVDALSASANDDKIAWYENTDGAGNFGPQQVISIDASSARSVFAADVDGDGDVDTLSASTDDDKIAWYENTDGAGNFGPQQVISSGANGARSVFATDVDGDGDVDVLSASTDDDKIAWYENTDGEPGGTMVIGGICPGEIIIELTGVQPNATVFFLSSDTEGVFVKPQPPCLGLELGLATPSVVTSVTANPSGTVLLTPNVDADVCGKYLQAVETAICSVSNVVQVP